MSFSKRKEGDLVAGWRLGRILGVGGNAEVWEAFRDSRRVALKILKRTNDNAEPYRRFRQEIAFLRTIEDEPGILGLLDFALPESPTFQNPAWLAMPVAAQLTEFLRGGKLEVVVSAIHVISATLARCAGRNIFHRDIKPSNLYSLDNRAVIGDFGLVHLPDREALTKSGKKFGPLFYLPDEMLYHVRAADPGPADVYMLAKSLWVLAAGQNLPPQGQIRTDNKQMRIGTFWNDAKAHLLDELIERCTDPNPEARPRMRDVTDELGAWLTYDQHPTETIPDFVAIGAKLKPSVRAHRDNMYRNVQIQKECDRLLEEIGRFLEPVASRMAEQTGLEVAVKADNHINTLVQHPARYVKEPHGPSINIVATVASEGRVGCGFLACGIGLMVALDVPTISLIAATGIRGGPKDELIWSKGIEVVPNSALEKQLVADLINELYKAIPDALALHADHVANTEPIW